MRSPKASTTTPMPFNGITGIEDWKKRLERIQDQERQSSGNLSPSSDPVKQSKPYKNLRDGG